MKKYLLLCCCVFMFSIALIGCNTSNRLSDLKIVRGQVSDNNFGVDYTIEDFQKGKYEISFNSKEYKKGTLIKDHNLYNMTLDTDNKKLPVSIYLENKNLKFVIDNHSENIKLDNFEYETRGKTLSFIENEKLIKLDEEVPVAIFGVSDKDGRASSTSLDDGLNFSSKEGFNYSSNEKDIAIYLKIKLIK